jgi:hypothetical protein
MAIWSFTEDEHNLKGGMREEDRGRKANDSDYDDPAEAMPVEFGRSKN